MTLREFLQRLQERHRVERVTPALSASMEQTLRFVRETQYNGWFITHCGQGVPKLIQFPDPTKIELTRIGLKPDE